MLAITDIPLQLRQDIFLDKEMAPQVITVRNFDENSTRDFNKEFQAAVQRRQPVILINIDSYGGAVYALQSMLTTIRNSPVPVATYTQSKAMSCGAMLLGFGTKGYRYAAPGAKIMLHEVSSATGGKVNEMIADTQECRDLNDEIFMELSRHCGWHEGYFHRMIHKKNHAEWYLRAPEAQKRKLIDVVGTPQLVTRVTVETVLEVVEKKGF